jgi:hypothetical protein
MAKVHIVQRSLHPHTQAIQTLLIAVPYRSGSEAEISILLRSESVPNDEKSIRDEIERLGNALLEAARAPDAITS